MSILYKQNLSDKNRAIKLEFPPMSVSNDEVSLWFLRKPKKKD